METEGRALEGPSDAELVRRAQSGDSSAFDALVRRHQRRAFAVSYRLLGNSADALEVTQDAFLKGFKSIGTLQNPDAFAGWQMRIVANLSRNYRRGRKAKWSLPLDDVLVGQEPAGPAASEDPQRRLQGREMGQDIKSALAKLPEKQRLAIVMFCIEQMPQKQVAEAMDCSVEAVKWHVFQGRKKLKELLGQYL